jgi:8-oxo-dGTP diphosphatase
MDKVTKVVCLVLMDESGAVLATQRPPGKRLAEHWEFPGGKIESGESGEEALRREIREELGIDLGDLKQLPSETHSYEFGSIELIPFLSQCAIRPGLMLTEHIAETWLHPHEYNSLVWAPADIPILEQLVQRIEMQ